jgi:tRNA threonylcarbamoyladenosine biosynthesis protein TsaE
MRLRLADTVATEAAGAALARVLPADDLIVYLQGDLGVGKTTLVRGLLRALGHKGRVPSPTYTLVEPYELQGRSLQHLDLYRIADPDELEFLGVRDMAGVLLIEWPERGLEHLPLPDIVCRLHAEASGRSVEAEGHSFKGQVLCEAWHKLLWSDGTLGLGDNHEVGL